MTARALVTSARARILGWYVALLAVALLLAVVAVRQVLVDHINHRIDAELQESAGALSALARTGQAPGFDEPITSVAQILSVGVKSGVPEQNATLIGLLDGRPYVHSPQSVPLLLDTLPSLVARWSDVRTVEYGSVPTTAGEVRYAAVPV